MWSGVDKGQGPQQVGHSAAGGAGQLESMLLKAQQEMIFKSHSGVPLEAPG